MRRIAYWTLPICLTALAWSATPAKKKAPGKKAPAKTSAAVKKAPTKSTGSKKAPAKSAGKGTTWRNRQLSPTAERYREIQESLIARGYLGAESATGKWDQDSLEALKKFQADQNLESNGKINSLSLIALGL